MLPVELVIFAGLPAAGKSTYYREHFASTHAHVSKDLMPNAARRDEKQQRLVEQALAAGRSVVVDNTNPTIAVRAPLIAIGRRHGARVVGYFFDCPIRACVMRNRNREGKERVPNVAIFTTAKKLVAPTIDEGFDEVRVIQCTPFAEPIAQ
jgi:predicted kinase